MAFVRKKTSRGCVTYSVVESYRDGGKVRQRVLAYLGKHPTIEAKIAQFEIYRDAARTMMFNNPESVASCEQEIAKLKALQDKLGKRSA